MQLRTADARAVLPSVVDRATAMVQASAVASMVAAFCTGDLSLLRGAIDDRIAEPARANSSRIPRRQSGGARRRSARLLDRRRRLRRRSRCVDGDESAQAVLAAMLEPIGARMEASGRVAQIDERGARISTVRCTNGRAGRVTAVGSRQGCEQCHAEISELDPAPVCPTCGGLLEIIHAGPSDANELRLRFAARRRLARAERSGVWRFRELVHAAATDDVDRHPPRGQHAAARRATRCRVGRC